MKTQNDYNRVNIIGLFAIVLISLISLTSCEPDTITLRTTSEVKQYTNTINGSTYLITKVIYKNNPMSFELDILNMLSTDSIYSITNFRYQEAHLLLERLQAMTPNEVNTE